MPKSKLAQDFEVKLDSLSAQELKELLMINTYKLAMARGQIEALSDILIKNNITTYEEIWKKTNDNLKESNI